MSKIIKQAEAVLAMVMKMAESDLEIVYNMEHGITLESVLQSQGFESRKEYLEFQDIHSQIIAAGINRANNMIEIKSALENLNESF